MAKKQSWSYIAGEKGRNRVRVFEDSKTGGILVEFYEHELGSAKPKRKRLSLGTEDRSLAKQKADELAAAFGKQDTRPTGELTLHRLFDIYLREVTPHKGERKQKHDRATAEMLLRFFGKGCKPRVLSRRDWDRFIHARRQGQIAPAGKEEGQTVGDRTVGYDLRFLLAVLNWASLSRDRRGEALLERNPLKGLPIPREESPKRPALSEVDYQALLRAAGEMDWRFEVALVLAHETGHRIGSVRRLRWSDVDLSRGTIRWRAENDKMGFEHVTPVTEQAAQALERARYENPSIGDTWVLPSPTDPSKPCSRYLVKNWWYKGEKRARLAHSKQVGWHSLRRKFASELKDEPLKDVCALGGWKSPITVLTCYQHADEERMRQALTSRNRRRVGGAG